MTASADREPGGGPGDDRKTGYQRSGAFGSDPVRQKTGIV